MAPFAEQAYDLVKHDSHFSLLNFHPQDWKLLKKQKQNMTNCPYSHKQKTTLKQTAVYVKVTETSCITMPPTAQGSHNSNYPHPFITQF